MTPWTIARQAPLSMEFSRQKYWSGLPFPSLRDLPNPGIEPTSPVSAGGFFTPKTLEKPTFQITSSQNGTWRQCTLLLWSIIPTRKSNPFLPRIELWAPRLCIWKGDCYKLHLTWIYRKVDIVSHISSQLIKLWQILIPWIKTDERRFIRIQNLSSNTSS